MDSGLVVDFLGFAAIWGAISPLAISLIKNVGGNWPKGAKQAVAVGFAALGALVAYGVTTGWGDVNLSDWSGFWVPLFGAFGAIYPIAFTTYQGFWSGTKVETAFAKVGAPGS